MGFDSVNFFDRLKNRLGSFLLMQIVFYTANGMFLPYRVVFLSERGLSSSAIGFILTISSLVTILAQPAWGMLCDRLGSIRKVFILCLCACMALVPALALVRSVLACTVLMTAISVFICPFFPLLDAWTMQGIKSMAGNPSYGSIRMWGSIAFAPAMLIMGWVVRATSINTAMVAYAVLNLFTLAVAFCIPIEGSPVSRSNQKEKAGNPVELFKNYKYITFVICYCLANIAAMSQLSFMPKRVDYAGGDTFTYSVMVAYGALCEVPMYKLSSWFMRKLKPAYLVIAAIVFTTAHAFMLSFSIPLWAVMVLQAMRGFSYGLFLVGNVYYVDSLAPDGLKASAQSISVTFSTGIAGLIGAGLGGVLIERIGILGMHKASALFAAASLAIFALTLFGGNIKLKRK